MALEVGAALEVCGISDVVSVIAGKLAASAVGWRRVFVPTAVADITKVVGPRAAVLGSTVPPTIGSHALAPIG
jgi:hypothetical protein